MNRTHMHRTQWQPFLKRWSEEWIRAHDPEQDAPLDDAVVRDGWLGFPPASEARLTAAEARLGRPLPSSLREFLAVTDGWRDAGCFIYRLAGADELAWLADTEEAHWIEIYEELAGEDDSDDLADDDDDGDDDGDIAESDDFEDSDEAAEAAILRRSLRISLEADAGVVLLDPEDVNEQGEWAAYWLCSWSGNGPERFDSFYHLMYDQYAGFHALRRPSGATRDEWDAKVESARLDLLAGETEEPLAVLEQASRFGHERADLLRFQALAMLGDRYTLPVSRLTDDDKDGLLLRNSLFAAELLPLLAAEKISPHLAELRPQSLQLVLADYDSRRRAPGFRPSFGNPEFDAAVHRLLGRLTADPAFHVPEPATPVWDPERQVFTLSVQATLHAIDSADAGEPAEPVPTGTPEERRQRLLDAAWPELREALRLWRPLNEDHIAPVSLLVEPAFAEMLTEERGREFFAMRRGARTGQGDR
ncbi:SMI1/KNR4 family protein [Streptomyces orinoci]|uniref:SMI1/KNR4 family protein n=1 Tax=Streptomyces orinoci TaxID=67339 RepID=A0ABV3JPP1_STRON|nr:SMI1/KNR4 family protein [Streptomyces orinoci]